MKRLILSAGAVVLPWLAATAFAADPPAMDDASRQSYALGYQLGRDLKGADLRGDAITQGLKDGSSGAPAKLTDPQMQEALAALDQRIASERAKAQTAELEKSLAAGNAYRAENAKKPGVQTTATGLQYKVVKAGTGRTPAASDTVTVNYRGTLVDGTEFDSSYKRGEPATFPVAGVIPGWTEALQLMKEGEQVQLVIPPDLGYGERGAGGVIPPGATLVFDVELISVAPQAAK
jgi:FKBP-type peptidyl-prolyl cis-trans isomerase FklB